ncbi:hypothetical protein [Piscinibacter sp.]|uniref:hypothetical protein n=1 Tax=Piscinibacter sp. TaxID=1903157 RepID=UPI002C6C3D42|nr:hypothetical protein [Albitalea sp.]HUG22522.1 hypothetical protein [Albitalea sp.]
MTTIAEFIDQAWNDHIGDPQGVAARLPQGVALLEQAPDKAGDFAQLAEHVLVAHLGDGDALARCLASLAPAAARHSDSEPALVRACLAAALVRGADTPAEPLPRAAAVRAHGSAVCGLASRGDVAAARSLLQSAAALARDAFPDDQDTPKALAACYHNLAAQLEEGPRGAERDALMMESARLSRSTWAEAGTWVNVERADYMLALCAAATGDGAQAVVHARSCLAVCESNGADAFERFFAHEALGRALAASGDASAAGEQLVRMRGLLGDIDESNRAYCQGSIDKLAPNCLP